MPLKLLFAFIFFLFSTTTQASDVILQNLNGKDTNLADHIGKHPVVLNFWASWCTSCEHEVPELNKLKKLAPAQTVFFGINVGESPEKAKRFAERYGFDFDILLDPEKAYVKSLHIMGIPRTIIYDSLGKEIYNSASPPSEWPQ